MNFFFRAIFLAISSSKAISSLSKTSSSKAIPSSQTSSSLRKTSSSRVTSSLQVIFLQARICSQPPPLSSATHFLKQKTCSKTSSSRVASSLQAIFLQAKPCSQPPPPLSSATHSLMPKSCLAAHPPWPPASSLTNSLRPNFSSPTCLSKSRTCSTAQQLSSTSSEVINQYNHLSELIPVSSTPKAKHADRNAELPEQHTRPLS